MNRPTDRNVLLSERVRFGRVEATLADWAWLLDASPRGVRTRILRGETVLDALRPHCARRVELPWELDTEVQQLVQDNPRGMTLEEIGDHFGLTRERIRQVQERAFRKLARELGPDWAEHIGEVLMRRGEEAA